MLTILSQMLPQFDFSEIRFKIHTEKCTSNVTLPKSVGSDPTPPQEQFWEMRKKIRNHSPVTFSKVHKM